MRERQVELQAEAVKRKNQADEYIEAVIKLINKDEGDVEWRQKRLDEEFNKAAKSLIDESISQELFRTFNEAYKTAREAIEHERQLAQQDKVQEQKKTAESYVGAVVKVLRDDTQSQDLLFKKLDTIFQEVVK